MKKDPRSFRSLINEVLAESDQELNTERDELIEGDEFALADEEDVRILMHREIHFGGNFDVMLEYYEQGGIGVDAEISFSRLFALSQIERENGENIAPLILSESDLAFVNRAKRVYEVLREACQDDSEEQKYARLIAELILSEEEDPEEEMEAIALEGEYIAVTLIELLESIEFASEFFPGYGRVPSYAVQCLGRIRSRDAVPILFEMLAHSDFDLEEEILTALRLIGVSAQRFLLKVIQGELVTRDHETAAFALLHFADDPKVATACLKELSKAEVRKLSEYAKYLALGCEKLTDPEEQALFRSVCNLEDISEELREEMRAVMDQWEAA